MLHQQRKYVAGRSEAVFGEVIAEGESREHRDVTLLLSLRGTDRVLAARMRGGSQPRGDRNSQALRSFSGVEMQSVSEERGTPLVTSSDSAM
jgi:hypothetical protein